MVKMLDLVGLPKNTNGFRTTHTCELCGFEPKTKNKYREKQDHLVMKHFKEKIDKIFPHCRPYTCPTPECEFTGKDKQALLRHYTGKHGILEQFLREALSERGINYSPGDHPKRKSSTESRKHRSSPSANNAATIMVQGASTIVNPKDFLPSTPLSSTAVLSSGGVASIAQPAAAPIKPNNEELRREVEAMMASFQPQPISTAGAMSNQPPLVVSLPQIPTLNLVSGGTVQPNGLSNGTVQNGVKTTMVNGANVLRNVTNNGPVSIALPTVPVQNMVATSGQSMPKLTPPGALPMNPLPPMNVILPQEPAKLTTTESLANGGPLPSLISNGRIIKTQNNVQLMRRTPPTMTTNMIESMPDLMLPVTTATNGFSNNGANTLAGTNISLPTLPSVLTIQQPNKMMSKLGSSLPMPIEALNGPRNSVASDPDSTPPSSIVMDDPSEMNADQTVVLENEEVMWSAPHGPAVVVEVADTVPVTYITPDNQGVMQGGMVTSMVHDGYSNTTLDNMEYDYLYPNTNGAPPSTDQSEHPVVVARERQLDFCML